LIFPSSATTRLQNSISKSLRSFSTLLDLLTSTFLLEKAIVKESRSSLKDAVQNHASAFKTLKNDLAEAKHERIYDPRIRGHKLRLYDAAIGSLARLAQHLNGLRSSTKLQENLIRAAREGQKNFGSGTMDIGSPWDQNGNGSSPTENGVKDHEEEMEMAASVRLLTRFRHMAGSQLDDLVVRPLPAEMKGQLTLMLRLNATMRSKPFNPSLKRQAVKSIYQASETP
jgi:hypothetical protein